MKTTLAADNMIFYRSVSWSAIFSGVLIALVAGLLCNLLGLGLGFSLFSPQTEVIKPLGMTALLWFIFAGALSAYLGSWVSTLLGNAQTAVGGAIYGLLVGGITTFISLTLMITAASAIFISSFSLLGDVISVSTSALKESGSLVDKGLKQISNFSPALTEKVKNAVPSLQPVVDKINQKAEALLPKKGEESVEKTKEVKAKLEKLIQAYLNSDEANYDEAEKDLVNSLAELTEQKPEKIKEMVLEWYQTYLQAKEKAVEMATEAANKVASIISQIAWMNFLILLSTLGAAMAGGIRGVNSQYRDEML